MSEKAAVAEARDIDGCAICSCDANILIVERPARGAFAGDTETHLRICDDCADRIQKGLKRILIPGCRDHEPNKT